MWLFRRIGVGKLLTLVLSVLYAITPFHWEKGENHLFLAAYFPVPLALVLVFWMIRGEPVWGVDRRPPSGGPGGCLAAGRGHRPRARRRCWCWPCSAPRRRTSRCSCC